MCVFAGEIAPVGPTSFEFMVPPDAPITVSPSVGTIQPGEVGVVYWLVCLGKKQPWFY